jgi:cytochrome b
MRMIESTRQGDNHALPPCFQRFRARLGYTDAPVPLDARASGGLAWVTGEAEGSLFVMHKLAGYGVAVLLVFRVIWGFADGRHSRFSDFVQPWRVVFAHIRGMLSLRPARALGHNPLGGWMALLLLVVLAAQFGTGLFASDDGLGGPLAGTVAAGTAHANRRAA